MSGGPWGAAAGGVGGLLSGGGGGGYFNQQEISPAVRDVALPGGINLRDRLTAAATNLATDPQAQLATTGARQLAGAYEAGNSPLDVAGRQQLIDILSGKYAGESGKTYQGMLTALQSVRSLEDQRAAEQIRQSAIAEGIGAGGGRAELTARDQQARDVQRRAQDAEILYNLTQDEQDRMQAAALQGGELQEREQQRRIAGMQAGAGLIGESQRYGLSNLDAASRVYGLQTGQLTPRSFAPSGFEQTVAGLGGLYGARAAGRSGGDLAGEYGYGGGILGGRGKTTSILPRRKYGFFGPSRSRPDMSEKALSETGGFGYPMGRPY